MTVHYLLVKHLFQFVIIHIDINKCQTLILFINLVLSGESLMKHCAVQIPKLKSRVTKVAGPEQQTKNETSGNKKKKGRK